MTAQEFLQTIPPSILIRVYMQGVKNVQEEMESCKTLFDAMPKKRKERIFQSMQEEYEECMEEVKQKQAKRDNAEKLIQKVSNEVYRRLLYDRYIDGLTWEKVADDLKYSVRTVYGIHKKALKAFEEVYNQEVTENEGTYQL